VEPFFIIPIVDLGGLRGRRLSRRKVQPDRLNRSELLDQRYAVRRDGIGSNVRYVSAAASPEKPSEKAEEDLSKEGDHSPSQLEGLLEPRGDPQV
jgi:hypothetical protein